MDGSCGISDHKRLRLSRKADECNPPPTDLHGRRTDLGAVMCGQRRPGLQPGTGITRHVIDTRLIPGFLTKIASYDVAREV